MKIFLILATALAAVLVVVTVVGCARNNRPANDPAHETLSNDSSANDEFSTDSSNKGSAGEAMMQLRNRLLEGSARQFGISPRSGVWGVLMEMGFPEGSATTVGLADGNASLYLSTGGGVIGGYEHEAVRAVAVRLCDIGARSLDATIKTSEYPMPAAGQVRFYLLTDSGVRTAETDEDSIVDENNRLFPLFVAGQNVVTELRKVTEQGEEPD